MSIPVRVVKHGIGRIVLSDGTVVILRIAIVDVKKIGGFSPFGANLAVKVIGGVGIAEIPQELRKAVADKPVISPDILPTDGWEYVEIKSQEPAFEEAEALIDSSKFIVRVEAEALMVVRNLKYRSESGEPIYVVNWANKVKWRPTAGGE